MSRETLVLRDGKFIPKHLAPPHPLQGLRVGSGPAVVSDGMPSLKHMASGRFHESKSAFRRDTKSFGCEELGNNAPQVRGFHDPKLPPAQADVAEAWAQLEAKI